MKQTDPIHALLSETDPTAVAIICGIDGPSYRPLGAMMAIKVNGERVGMLSSGCIENDAVLHALTALQNGKPAVLRYGKDSPFFDIQLPCGGGLDILVIPNPDTETLSKIAARREARQSVTLQVSLATGAMSVSGDGETGLNDKTLNIRYEPELRFLVFGKGPEAASFSSLLAASDYDHLLISNDAETLERAKVHGCKTQFSNALRFPHDMTVDHRTSIVLFFHDHDQEPEILAQALRTPAFYIGAQGSRRARHMRDLNLEALGVTDELGRVHGPIGLIPSVRDPRTLSVSVLAEILAKAATLS